MRSKTRSSFVRSCLVVATTLSATGTLVADGPFLLLPTVLSLPTPKEGSLGATHFAVADLDRDDDLDVVITGRNNEGLVPILWNDGDGGFPTTTVLEAGGQTDWVEIADLDGDGNNDLVLAVRAYRGRVVVFRGRGDGTFQEPEEIRLGRDVRCALLRDLDGDGDLDLAALNHREPVISVLLNDGTGVLASHVDVVLGGASVGITYPQSMAAADFDGDGDQDLAVVCTGSGRVSILGNRGDATFDIPEAWRPTWVDGELGGMSMAVAGDVDSDGDPDLVVPLLLTGDVSHAGVFTNRGTTEAIRFDRDTAVPLVSGPGFAYSIGLADLDGDGDLDVIGGHAIPGPITVLDNRTVPIGDGGDGTIAFEPPQLIGTDSFFRCVSAADLDGDCDLEVIALDLIANSLWIFDNLTPQENGCGDGGSPRRANVPSPIPTPASAEARPTLEVGDLDGDGRVTGADYVLWLDRMGGPMPAKGGR